MRYSRPSRSINFFGQLFKGLVREPDLQPVSFSNPNFTTLPSDVKVEEEAYDDSSKGKYYPARIGEIIVNKYQIVGKLGYGLESTVWLANDSR